MRLRLLLVGFMICFVNAVNAQTFNGAGGAIPDSGALQGIYPIDVNGIGIINSSLGVASVCVNIIHPWVSDLEIYLKAPDGTTVPVSIQNGGSGDNYNGTCFSGSASIPLEDGIAPFTGSFIPDGYIGAVNNGQNADGTWQLIIKDIALGETGSLTNWSINFSSALPPSPPACNGNLPPGNTCAEATPVCSFYGFCGITSPAFTADSWPELATAFCGTIQNNAYVKFVATGYEMNFNVWVTSSINHDGIQMLFFDGGCGSGSVTEYGCYSPVRPGASPFVVSATGLTTGHTYYLMIDGFAGDVCDYIIEPLPATNGLTVTAQSASVCLGKEVELTATGGSGFYSWSGAGLNTYSGNTVIASPVTATSYSVSSIDPGGICPITKQVSISVMNLPDPPSVPDTVTYCQREISLPLTATGTHLLWYTMPAGGIGNQQAIVPSTINPGLSTYYVTQTITCESQRAGLYVFIKPGPEINSDIHDTACSGSKTDLTRHFNINGLNSTWSFNGMPIDPPQAVTVPGTYQLDVTNYDGCSGTGLIHFSIQPPVHVFAGDDTIAVKGIPHRLFCSPAYRYAWEPADLLNFANIQNPLATLYNDQQFVVRVSDIAGCTGSDTILVKLVKGIDYYIPNAFTPNSDGLNDIFRAIPAGIVKTEIFKIVNRYGKTVFASADPFAKGWDGSCAGVPQAEGAYVWFVKGKDINGKTLSKMGTVVLIR